MRPKTYNIFCFFWSSTQNIEKYSRALFAVRIPAGTRFVLASDGGKAEAGKVRWNLATLMPNRSRKVSVTLMSGREGTVTNTTTATAMCAEGVRASASTIVAGIPAVLLEVIDIDDPVEVGCRTTSDIPKRILLLRQSGSCWSPDYWDRFRYSQIKLE